MGVVGMLFNVITRNGVKKWFRPY